MIPRFLFTSILVAATAPAQTTVFWNDLDGTLPSEIQPGVAALVGVQGYAGLGHPGNQFGGTFLRSPTGNVVTLTVANLPAHRTISLAFLFAAIDSLDGTGTFPSGDFFHVTLDGRTLFRESFANALPSQFQSYVPPPGVELARRIDLGFSGPGGYYLDSAYDLGADPLFANIPHAGSTAVFTFQIEGPGIQPLEDESWAMDRVRVSVDATVTGSVAAYGLSCGPQLQAPALPRLGQAFPLTLGNLPPATVLAYCALGLASFQLPLDPFGMTGCWLLQDLAIASDLPMFLSGNAAALVLPLPNHPTFLAFPFFAQGWAVVPGANSGGALFSGGLRVVIGS